MPKFCRSMISMLKVGSKLSKQKIHQSVNKKLNIGHVVGTGMWNSCVIH